MVAQIEASQIGSTSSVYETRWTVFSKLCHSNQVDFRASPIKPIANLLLYIFKDRKLQPSTIDDYRSAIAYMLGNSPNNVAKMTMSALL